MSAGDTETVGLVQQFVERTGQLYSLPAVAAEVLRLTGEPQIDPRLLRQCIESDPALAARLLRVVNSSLFGPTRQVSDLNQALTLLGIRPLKMLVLGFSLPKELFAGLEAEVLARYWRRTLVKAVAARELCERLWRIPGDEPFLAGLVQDIGVLALVQQLGGAYLRLLERVDSLGQELIDRELEALGFDHLVLSARLLAHWGLPAGLCAAVSVPPNEARIDELEPKERVLPEILHLSDLFARLIDQPQEHFLTDLLTAGRRYCGLTMEIVEPIFADLQDKVGELAEVLSLQLPAGQSYVDLLLAAQSGLANETVSVAAAMATPDEDELLSATSALRVEMGRAVRRGAIDSRGRSDRFTERAPGSSRGFELFDSQRGEVADVARSPAATMPSRLQNSTSTNQTLLSYVAAAIHRSRQVRKPVTLALFEIDRFGDLLLQASPVGMAEIMQALRCSLADWTNESEEALQLSDSRLAMVWERCSRSDGLQRARECLSQVRSWSGDQLGLSCSVTLSIGVATLDSAPKNYPAQELIDAAQRCLCGAELSGGDTVKSIGF